MEDSSKGAGAAAPAPTLARGSLVAITGLVFVVLYLVAWLLIRFTPSYDAGDQEILDYYGDAQSRTYSTIAGLYVIPLAAIFFIWFVAAIRDRYHRSAPREHMMYSLVQIIAAALVVTSLFTAAGVELSVAWLAGSAETFDVDVARGLLAVRDAVSEIMALRAAAVFVLVSGARAMRIGLFPRFFLVLTAIVVFALLFVHMAVPWVSVLFPLWVAGASILVLVRRPGRASTDIA